MNEEEGFLRALLANPEDAATRLVYADWLEERGEAGAEILRADVDLFRLSYLDWIEGRGWSADHYLRGHWPLLEDEPARAARKRKREKLLRSDPIRPSRLAFLRTLGSPPRPFRFWSNTGPRSFGKACVLPLSKRLRSRGDLITFDGQFLDGGAWDAGLAADLQSLAELEPASCEYGSATCPLHPFLCDLPTDRWPLTGRDVLTALHARRFRSRHIPDLDATDIDHPGYHPGRENDEIHNRFRGQHLFASEDGEDEQDGLHGELKRHVEGGRLWYVLLHPKRPARWVLLFAVGKSRHGRRLIGVVSHQSCHNLCD
jgi:uncharacterized protein (TIGR02996 family)